jgi:hypothetical protein
MRTIAFSVFVIMAISAVGCPKTSTRSEGLDVADMPKQVQSDYVVFAQRCSKCHSLARPLSSGIDDDGYWAMYVARMRAQPGSGISENDTVPILRFLHQYSLDSRRKKGEPLFESAPPPNLAPSAPGGPTP